MSAHSDERSTRPEHPRWRFAWLSYYTSQGTYLRQVCSDAPGNHSGLLHKVDREPVALDLLRGPGSRTHGHITSTGKTNWLLRGTSECRRQPGLESGLKMRAAEETTRLSPSCSLDRRPSCIRLHGGGVLEISAVSCMFLQGERHQSQSHDQQERSKSAKLMKGSKRSVVE